MDPARFDRLRDAEAALRLRRPRARERVIDSAVALMLDGVDLPEVVIVAGDDRVDDRELERDLDRALTALGLELLQIGGAAFRLATAIANDILVGAGDLRASARSVWDLWLAAGPTDNRLAQFAYVADGFVDLPTYFPESALREAAAGLVAQAPTG
jgi:hypothetical protein